MNNQHSAKEFIATSISAALRMVKAEFGPDAIILSQESKGSNTRIIALPAGAKMPQSVNDEMLRQPQENRQNNRTNSTLYALIDEPLEDELIQDEVFSATYLKNTASKQEEVSQYIKSELASIKDLLQEKQLKEKSKAIEQYTQSFDDIQLAIVRKLHKCKFELGLINNLVAMLPTNLSQEAAWQYVIDKLKNLIPFDKVKFSPKRVKSFVGPSGVGKSLLLAKLLVYFANRPLQNNFCIIFVNNANLKVLEESKVYARLFGIPTYYAESLDELEKAYKQTIDKQHVFVDFPAFDFGCPENNFYLPFLEKYKADIDNTLVVSSHCQLAYIERFYNAFQKHLVDGLSITKLDENNSFDEIMSFVVNKQIPLRNLSFGSLNFTNGFSSRLIFADKNYFQDYFSNTLLQA